MLEWIAAFCTCFPGSYPQAVYEFDSLILAGILCFIRLLEDQLTGFNSLRRIVGGYTSLPDDLNSCFLHILRGVVEAVRENVEI